MTNKNTPQCCSVCVIKSMTGRIPKFRDISNAEPLYICGNLTCSCHKLPSAMEERFDEKFGIAGIEMNCDSRGRKTGCDDCSTNIKLREEHKKFLKAELSRVRAEGYEKGIADNQKKGEAWRRGYEAGCYEGREKVIEEVEKEGRKLLVPNKKKRGIIL